MAYGVGGCSNPNDSVEPLSEEWCLGQGASWLRWPCSFAHSAYFMPFSDFMPFPGTTGHSGLTLKADGYGNSEGGQQTAA
jgi:hypothetical protein